jgi:TatD DNase family protein
LADQTDELWDSVCDRASALSAAGLLAGIGETGFDRFRTYSEPENQLDAFQRHCDLARKLDMPLIIHSRAAEEETLRHLEEYASDLTVVLHCFALPDHVDEVLERGYYCSFAGNVTYPSAISLREAVSVIPPERLLVETDAPFLAPVPERGKSNHPQLVTHTFSAVAQAARLEPETLAAIMETSVETVFGFSKLNSSVTGTV